MNTQELIEVRDKVRQLRSWIQSFDVFYNSEHYCEVLLKVEDFTNMFIGRQAYSNSNTQNKKALS